VVLCVFVCVCNCVCNNVRYLKLTPQAAIANKVQARAPHPLSQRLEKPRHARQSTHSPECAVWKGSPAHLQQTNAHTTLIVLYGKAVLQFPADKRALSAVRCMERRSCTSSADKSSHNPDCAVWKGSPAHPQQIKSHTTLIVLYGKAVLQFPADKRALSAVRCMERQSCTSSADKSTHSPECAVWKGSPAHLHPHYPEYSPFSYLQRLQRLQNQPLPQKVRLLGCVMCDHC